MATQRITVAKVGGVAAEVVMFRLQEWSESRQATDRDEWSSEQWPPDVRRQADDFADRLRSHALVPPVIYYVEWADPWSMGDLFCRCLTPSDAAPPLTIHADRFEIYRYGLPDGDRLRDHLSVAGPRQWEESDWFVGRLLEAVGAWQGLVDRAALIMLREVVGGLVTDDELVASLDHVPDWLSENGTHER